MLTQTKTEDLLADIIKNDLETIEVRVEEIFHHTFAIKGFKLVSNSSTALASFEPGAHIKICIPSAEHGVLQRSYSLINSNTADYYEIAVQLENNSTGGSTWMHKLKVGDIINIIPPENAFPMNHAEQEKAVLIAGGIGITPILSMVRALSKQGREFDFHYAARSKKHMAFFDEVSSLDATNLYIDDGQTSKRINLDSILANYTGQHVYVCGPVGLIRDVIDHCKQAGWPESKIHYELFAGAIGEASDSSFELNMKATGKIITVPKNMTILEAVITEGVFAPFECQRGECGMCVTPVIEGDIDHRDEYLTKEEREAGNLMCICVSRAGGARLVLDI